MYELPMLVLLSLVIALGVMNALLIRSASANKRGATTDTDPVFTQLMRIENRISSIEQQLCALPLLEQRIESLHTGDKSYELAQRLARQGTNLEQLIATCGLSQREAELVLQLHSAAKAVPA